MVPTTESYRQGLTRREAFFLSTLAREGRAIFSMSDARQILGAKTRQTLSLLSKKKWVLRLRRGLYVIVPIDAGVRGSESFIVHDFVIASHLASPYYVGFWSALNHHGLTDQIPRTVFVATTRPRKPLKILTSTFRFVQLAPKKFIGIETASFEDAAVRISSKEKTLVDCLDHPELAGGIEEVARAVYFNHRELDWAKVRQDLHGDLAAESAVPREVHFAHSAPAERSENLAIAEDVAGSQHSPEMIRARSPSSARRRVSETGSCQIDRGHASIYEP